MHPSDFFPLALPNNATLSLLTLVALALGDGNLAVAGEEENKISVKTIKDIAYYEGPDVHAVKHKLDLFLPEGKKDFPILLFAHGGAWMHGDKNFMGFYSAFGKSLARQGIGAVVTNYRLSPTVKHPEHVKDIARAVAWTVKNISKHGGNPDQLFLCGHSAGAHLISLLSTDESYLKEVGLGTKNIKGAIPISGVYAIPDRFLPLVFGADGEDRRKASPIHHVRAGLPPFLILYADKDLPGCDKKPSELFRKALEEKGVKVQSLEIKDSNHYSIIVSAAMADSPVAKGIVEFIRGK